jgi:hypothetical protein
MDGDATEKQAGKSAKTVYMAVFDGGFDAGGGELHRNGTRMGRIGWVLRELRIV